MNIRPNQSINDNTNTLDTPHHDLLHDTNNNRSMNSPAPSEPIRASYPPQNIQREVSLPNDPSLDAAPNENIGIGATNTIDIYLCIEDPNKKDTESLDDDISIQSDVTQRHNKYMFSNKSQKQFYFAPYNKAQDSNWHIFDYNDIFSSKTSFLSDIFSNVMQPLIHSFKNGKSGCLAIYSPDKTSWNDRLQLFDIVHQILLQLNIDRLNCKISAYEVNDDDAYDLLPIKASHSASIQYTSSNILQFSRSKKNRTPLKLSLNRSLHYVFQNINKIGIKSIETGLQYFERSHNLFKSSKSSHYVFSITTGESSLRIVQLCTADPMRNQALLNMRQCIKVLKRNKSNQTKLKKSLYVPYRRHIFTKLFQEFIDGTSSFSFLFYLPSIHTHKIKESLYLDRILSLLNYSCKTKHVSKVAPVSQAPSSFASTIATPQNEANPLSMSMLDHHNNRNSLSESLLQTAESTNINMKTLLNKAYDELELSRQQTEKLLSNKNETIQQLSMQVDSVRSECQKKTESLRDEMKTLTDENEKEQHKSKQYRKQINVLHQEIKVMNSSTEQIKFFLSEITKLLQIDLDKAQSLSWKDILRKVAQQKSQLDEANETIASLESAMQERDILYHSNGEGFEQKISQSQQIIEDQDKEIEILKKKVEEQSKQNELLTTQMEEIRRSHGSKVVDISTEHKAKLNELRTALDELSADFSSLKSSQQNSPKKSENKEGKENIDALKGEIVHLEFQSVVHQQLTYKVQQIHDKLQKKVTRQKDAYKAEIAALNDKCTQLQLENDIFNGEISELNVSLSTKQEEVEAITSSYKALLDQIAPLQDHNKRLTAEYENILKKINDYKQTQKQLTTQYMLSAFQCAVYRQLNTSLKKQIKDKQSDSNSHDKELQEYQKLLQMKDKTHDKLRCDYHELRKEFDSQLSIANDLRNENIVKSLKEDKENLQDVNKKLQQQTNVYRFQSAAHQKIAQSAKHQKNKLKSHIVELLAQHAPDDQIKDILRDKTAIHHQKICTAPSLANALPCFEDIETPKSGKQKHTNIDSELLEENTNLKGQMRQLQNTINSLKKDSNHQLSMFKMKRTQERNKWIHKVAQLKEELRDIMAAVRSSTKYIYQETKCEIRKAIKEYDGTYHVTLVHIENENSKLKVEVKKLLLTNESLEQQVREKNNQIDRLHNELQSKHENIEQLQNDTKSEQNKLKQKHDMIVKQCVSISKINESMQIENNQLIDESIVYKDNYQELQIQFVSMQHKYDKLSQYLFKRILLASCYKHKCSELEARVAQLHKDREHAQTNLTVEQLKMLQLNDEVTELKQMNEAIESNRTGLMLETMEANNTIHQLIEENKVLKTTVLSKQVENMKEVKRTQIQTDIKYCNDSNHEQTIETLRRKFSVMCLKMDKLQMESLDYVQKAVALRDDNIKLKKENRRNRRNVRHLQAALDELRSKNTEKDPVNTQSIKTEINQHCIQMNDIHTKAIESTTHSVDEMHQRLNACVDKMKVLKFRQTTNKQKEKYIKNIMIQMNDVSDDIINGIKQRLEEKCTLFDMRCDGVSRNINLIKHALDTKQSEDQQLQLKNKHHIEKHLYDLQFATKVMVKTFKNEMMHNIKHVIECHAEEFQETKSTISKTFELAMQKYDESLKGKDAMIDELKSILSTKSNQFDVIHKTIDQYKSYRNDYNALKCEYDKLKQVESKYHDLQSANDTLENKMVELQETIQTMTKKEEKMRQELDNEIKVISAKNASMKQEIDKLERATREKDVSYQLDTERYKEQISQSQQMIKDKNKEIECLEGKFDEQSKKMEELRHLHEHKVNDIANDHDKELGKVKHIESQLENQLLEKTEYIKDIESKYDDIQHVKDTLENKICEQNEIIQQLSTEKENMKQIELKYEELQNEMSTAQELIKESESVQHQLQHEIKQMVQQIEELRQENDELKTEISQQKEQMLQKDSNMEILQNEIKQKMEKIEQIKQEHGELKTDIAQQKGLVIQKNNNIEALQKERDDLMNKIQDLETQLQDNKMNISQIQTQEKELVQLRNELEKTKKQRNKYYKDKQLLQQEMQLVGTQLDELNASKTHLVSQMEKLSEFHSDSAQLKVKLHQYSQMNTSTQQRIQQLELMKNMLEKDNTMQLEKMDRVYAENESLKQEIISCDAQITKLKECILTKFNDLNAKYISKVNTIQQLEQQIAFKQKIIDELKENMIVNSNCTQLQTNEMKQKYDRMLCKFNDLDEEYALKANQMERAKDRIKDLEYRLSVKNQRIQCLQTNVNEIKSKYEAEKIGINYKLETLQIVIVNKLNSVTNALHSKDIKINELSSMLTVRGEELRRVKYEINKKLQYEDENEMLAKYKHKLEAQVAELNRNLNALHSKHRVVKQSLDKTHKLNRKMQTALKDTRDESFHLQKQLKFAKHENEQINKHRDHIKEKCDELESSLKRYRDRFKSAVKECVLLRKKGTVLEQLVRCSDNEIGELQFDKKSANVREKILSDLLENNEEDALFKVDDILREIQNTESDDNASSRSDDVCYEVMLQRIEDLKSECNHYKETQRLNDENIIDLKQQTAFHTHQILENWQKMFDKLVSMINIKSYTIEIMQKSVCDIMKACDKDLQQENQILIKNLDDMKEDVRKLEAKHRKEKVELQGLLDREVHLAHSQKDCMEKELNVYKSKLQKFYKKYHRSTEHQEHQKLAAFMDNMRHEMTQISQENVTMATVTNSLREIVREHQDKTHKLETQNEEMYEDLRGLCQYMQAISGEAILSEDEENMYSASNLPQMVSVVKQRALSISSSRSSLHNNEDNNDDDGNEQSNDEEYTIVHHNDTQQAKSKSNECPLCEQEFNAMVWKYKCSACQKHHCSLCAPIRKNYQNQKKCRVCHQCYHP